jgi:hypothetical protein
MAIIPIDADILPPSDDHIFKTLLTHPNAECVVVDVVSAATNHNIVNAQVLDNELPITDANEKNERLDVNCTVIDKNGQKRQINVEMQGSRMGELKEVGMASELLMEISQDEAERARIRSRKKFEMDRTSDILTAEERGRAEIIELLEKGVSLDEVKRRFGQ